METVAAERARTCCFTAAGSALISVDGRDIGLYFFCKELFTGKGSTEPRNEPRIESDPLMDFRIWVSGATAAGSARIEVRMTGVGPTGAAFVPGAIW